MPNLGPMEILVVFVVALLVLGPQRLPEAGRQVGKALAELRRWTTGVQNELRDTLETDAEPQPPPVTPAAAMGTPETPGPADLQPSQAPDRPQAE